MACQRIFVGWPAIQYEKPETTMAAVRKVSTKSERANLPGRFVELAKLCQPTDQAKRRPPALPKVRHDQGHEDQTRQNANELVGLEHQRDGQCHHEAKVDQPSQPLASRSVLFR
jgi:hypothetical protein